MHVCGPCMCDVCVHVVHGHVYMCTTSVVFSRVSNLSFIFSPIFSMSRSHMFLLYYCPPPQPPASILEDLQT